MIRLFLLCMLFCSVGVAQDLEQKFDLKYGIELFRYDDQGLHPKKIHYQIDSLSAAELYNKVKFAFEFGSDLIVDEKNKLTKKVKNTSFILKGRRYFVFCSEGLFGTLCLDAKYDIEFVFYDGGFSIEPLKFKRGANADNSVWTNVPFDGRANYYKKDGTLKKQCTNCPEGIENILDRVVVWGYGFALNVEPPDSM